MINKQYIDIAFVNSYFSYPLEAETFINYNKKFCFGILQKEKLNFSIKCNDVFYDDFSCNTVEEMVKLINGLPFVFNTSEGVFYNFSIFIFEEISDTAPPLNIYGFNSLFGSLKGAGNYRKKEIVPQIEIPVFLNVFNFLFQTKLTSIEGNYDIFRLCRHYKSYYKVRHKGDADSNYYIINKCFDDDTGIFSIEKDKAIYQKNSKKKQACYVGRSYSGDYIFFENSRIQKHLLYKQLKSGEISSVCVFYLMKLGLKYYIEVRPLGIDTIMVNSFDFEKYQMEMLISYDFSQKSNNFYKIPNEMFTISGSNESQHYLLNLWQLWSMTLIKYRFYSYAKEQNVKLSFQLRNKNNNAISYQSSCDITLSFKGDGLMGRLPFYFSIISI